MLNKMLGASYTFYSADIDQIKNYYCTCEETFKERYNNHAAPLRNKSKEKKSQKNTQNISGSWKIITNYGLSCP